MASFLGSHMLRTLRHTTSLRLREDLTTVRTHFTTMSSNFRLPSNVQPTDYDLTIKTDLKKELFEGFVKIRLEVKEKTSTLTFNVADLELSNISLFSRDLKTQQNTLLSFDSKAEQGTLDFPEALPANSTATLSIAFSGKLTGAMMGYYKSTYEDDGEKKVYSLTQFEPTAARRAFPCWDEPSLKARFTITMISRMNTINLSNMSVASEEAYKSEAGNYGDATLAKMFAALDIKEQGKDEWKVTKFNTTPFMSTYLVAYANGQFSHLESSYKSPLTGKVRPLRIYGTADVISRAKYALDVKTKVLPLYEQIFDIEYPLPKLDTLVAHDFDAGAMENWGLITGRTSAFLMDLDRPDMATKQRITVFQSHEVAHMWFGDIATMEWWDYLYLNEGFATLMGEVIIIDRVHPEWKVDSKFITGHLNDALRLDAKLSSHPIEVQCPDANQINQIFDSLSYAKAASVLRMLCNFVGQDVFLKGVSIYLKDHLYGNTTTKDLWNGINKATQELDGVVIDVAEMMENWIAKMGFPVLTVTECQDGIRVRQDRYLESGPAEEKDDQTIWTIPLAILTVGETGRPSIDKTAVLTARETILTIDTSKPYKLNAGTYGVYRVLYPKEQLTRIALEAAQGDAVFSLNDRIGLVHDTMALAKSGHATVSSALTVVDIFRNEPEFLVWDSIAENLALLVSTWWENEEIVQGLNEFRKKLFKPIVDRLGYVYSPSEPVDISQLRTSAIGQAAAAGDQAVVATLREMFKTYMATGDESKIPVDLFRTTAINAVKYGGVDEYNFVKGLYEDRTTLPSVGISAMYAMCASKEESCNRDTERFILNKARSQDIIYFFSGQQMNYGTRRSSVKFFMDNFELLEERYKGTFSFQFVIPAALGNLGTKSDIEWIKKFFEDKDTSRYNLALAQTLDSLRASAAWIERSTTDISEWLEKRSGKI
ncbi:leucyl aminopeptidase [Boletus edulis BED1]|uniref:Aminopeptidase n=1 Tax=Boletus edulis BED1 TaxID=1328754 RepID=A0AAD4C5D5_BOLED|nr:leucyl aminopeptidase [Boletus edulis BED1]